MFPTTAHMKSSPHVIILKQIRSAHRVHSKPFMAGPFKGTTLFYICGHRVVNVLHKETGTPVHTHIHMREYVH